MSNKKEYTSLSAVDAIRIRPGMYVGDVSDSKHLLTEIVDNVLDEISNKHASQCHVYYNNGQWWVTDDGRGFEIYEMTLHDGRVKDSIHALCTEAHSGSKFDNEDYDTLIGMHGVGLVVVNALSKWMMIRTRDRSDHTKMHEYYFLNGELDHHKITNNKETWSTQVGFEPNPKYFRSVEFDLKPLIERLMLSQSKFENSTFTFNNKPLTKMDFSRFVRNYLKLEDTHKLYNIKYSNNDWHIDVYMTYTKEESTVVVGDVNLRFCDGTYLTSFQSLLKANLIQNLDRKYKDVASNLLSIGLKLYISLTVPEPQFASQEKVRMTLPIKDELLSYIEYQIAEISKQPEILEIVKHNIESRMNSHIIKTKTKNAKRVSNDNKLRDCTQIPGNSLYILEGDSALGTLKQIRDTATEAIFPLRGKVLNVESSTIDKIRNNKEIKYLLESLGPKGNRRYYKIKIIADADPDGWHIVVLTLLILIKFADDYIKTGNVSIILPPLYGASKGKQYLALYDHSKAIEYQKNGYNITRFKGLGEMNPNQLKESIKHGVEYVVTWPDSDQLVQSLKSIITNGDVKRSLMDNPRCTFDRVLQEAVQQN